MNRIYQYAASQANDGNFEKSDAQTGLHMNRALRLRSCHFFGVRVFENFSRYTVCHMHISVATCISDLCENSFSHLKVPVLEKTKCSE